MDKLELKAIINDELVIAGFKRKQTNWYLKTDLGVLLFNLQQSDYGKQFYINLASAPIEIDTEGFPTPKEYKCPLRLRLGMAFPQLSDELKLLLDLENHSISDTDRAQAIRRIVKDYSIPFLLKINGLVNIKRSLEDGTLNSASIRKVLGELIV